MCVHVFVSVLGGLLEPVDGVGLLEAELVAHLVISKYTNEVVDSMMGCDGLKFIYRWNIIGMERFPSGGLN